MGDWAILCDTGVIVWKWLCVLPLVTCSSVMVTSHCWPFPYNYPVYLSDRHRSESCIGSKRSVVRAFLSLSVFLLFLFLFLFYSSRQLQEFYFVLRCRASSCMTKSLKACVFVHTRTQLFHWFFPLCFILCTNETSLSDTLIFFLFFFPTNAKPTSGMMTSACLWK